MRVILSICLFMHMLLPTASARCMGGSFPVDAYAVHVWSAASVDTTDKGKGKNPSNPLPPEEERSLLAKWLDVPVDIIGNLDLFRFIREWHKTPYRFGGTQKSGIDCSAFTQKLYKEIYDLTLQRMVSLQRKQVIPVEKSKLIQGDLIFFHTTRPGLSHVGVYLGGGLFIHASATRGVVIDNLDSPYYTKAFRVGGRMVDLNAYIRSFLFR